MNITLQYQDVVNAITSDLASQGLALPIREVKFSKVTKTKPLVVTVEFGDEVAAVAAPEATTSAPLSFEDSE